MASVSDPGIVLPVKMDNTVIRQTTLLAGILQIVFMYNKGCNNPTLVTGNCGCWRVIGEDVDIRMRKKN